MLLNQAMKPIEQSLSVFLVGATGDLSQKKILPALYHLFSSRLLPEHFYIIGTARKNFTQSEFHDFVKNVVLPKNETDWLEFCKHVHYVAGDVSSASTALNIRKLYESLDQCANHLWYVATLPQLYVDVVRNIKNAGLHTTVYGWTKLLIEKPFGTDLTTAQKLNQELLQVFNENDIYRIDHFLGKETVQNLLAFRFANGAFEHLWNWRFVDYITVTATETLGVGGRTAFYDKTGAVRDIFQNHILQMLAMTLMEEPISLSAHHIDIRRQEFIKSLREFNQVSLADSVLFGQYTAGNVQNAQVLGYLDESGINKNSKTETAFACKLYIDTDRWQDVPVYVRLGKRMAKKITEISIHFKEPFNQLFQKMEEQPRGNILTLRITPNEGIIFRMYVKKPGLKFQVQEVPMRFYYKHVFQMDLLEAYVKLLHDAILGDATLFPRANGIEESWRFVQPILDYVKNTDFTPEPYKAGTWGPLSFTHLLKKENKNWT